MPINSVTIKNFKSIKNLNLNLNQLNVLLGQNGTGKTNIIEAIRYYYDSMTEEKIQNTNFDIENPFSNEIEISITFDISRFLIISRRNLKNEKR